MNSILFVRLSAMGDLVQSLGAVAGLVVARPDVQATIVTQEPFVPLLRGIPGLKRVVPFRRHDGLRGLRQVRDALRQDSYDIALDLQGNWKSAVIACFSGARLRLGARGRGGREQWSRMLLDRTLQVDGVPHPARVAWELVRTVAPEVAFRLPRLTASEAETAAEQEAVQAAGVDPERPFQVIVVTDPADPRALPPEVVARALRSAAGPVLQLLGPAEAHVAPVPGTAVLRHAGNQVRRLIAMGVLVARAGGHVLASDQGAVHVLSAAGARCTVMFGSQDPRRTAAPAVRAVVHPQPPPCSPCRLRRCSHPRGPVCMAFDPASGEEVDLGLQPPA